MSLKLSPVVMRVWPSLLSSPRPNNMAFLLDLVAFAGLDGFFFMAGQGSRGGGGGQEAFSSQLSAVSERRRRRGRDGAKAVNWRPAVNGDGAVGRPTPNRAVKNAMAAAQRGPTDGAGNAMPQYIYCRVGILPAESWTKAAKMAALQRRRKQ